MSDHQTMTAGPDLDRMVAEKVMGWTWRVLPMPSHYAMAADGCMGSRWFDGDRDTRRDQGWRPSINIADAWQVVERLCANVGALIAAHEIQGDAPPFWRLDCPSAGRTQFHFSLAVPLDYSPAFDYFEAHEETAQLAICRAALAAVAQPLHHK